MRYVNQVIVHCFVNDCLGCCNLHINSSKRIFILFADLIFLNISFPTVLIIYPQRFH